MTPVEAQKLVTVLTAAFPTALSFLDTQQLADTMAAYRSMLADLDYPVGDAAVERVLATANKLPAPAEIREAAAEILGGHRRAGGEAWGTVLKAIGRWGAQRTPGVDFRFLDPLVAQCVDAFGWRVLCLSEDQTADRARFIELYDKLAASARRELVVGQLPAARRMRELQAARAARGAPQITAGDRVPPLRLVRGEEESVMADLVGPALESLTRGFGAKP